MTKKRKNFNQFKVKVMKNKSLLAKTKKFFFSDLGN